MATNDIRGLAAPFLSPSVGDASSRNLRARPPSEVSTQAGHDAATGTSFARNGFPLKALFPLDNRLGGEYRSYVRTRTSTLLPHIGPVLDYRNRKAVMVWDQPGGCDATKNVFRRGLSHSAFCGQAHSLSGQGFHPASAEVFWQGKEARPYEISSRQPPRLLQKLSQFQNKHLGAQGTALKGCAYR